MFCSQCGTKLQENAKFCFQCGVPIASSNESKAELPPRTNVSRLVPMKCTNCGGYVEFKNNLDTAQCPFCNSTFIVERAINNFNVSNGGRDYNTLLALIDSNLKADMYMDALDYMWQAHILAPLSDRPVILSRINQLIDKAYDRANYPLKVIILKYKALRNLIDVDSNFMRRIWTYEYHYDKSCYASTGVYIEGHGINKEVRTKLYASRYIMAIVNDGYIGEEAVKMIFNKNEVKDLRFEEGKKTFFHKTPPGFSFTYREQSYSFITKDPNDTRRFIKNFYIIENIDIDNLRTEVTGSDYRPLLEYIERYVSENDSELNKLIHSNKICSPVPGCSIPIPSSGFSTKLDQMKCYNDELQIWKSDEYNYPEMCDDLTKFKYFRVDDIGSIKFQAETFLFSKDYWLRIYSKEDNEEIYSLLVPDEHYDNVNKMVDFYSRLGVKVIR